MESLGVSDKSYSLNTNASPLTFICFFLPLTFVTWIICPISSIFCFLGVLEVASSYVSMASEKSLLLVLSKQLSIGVILSAIGTMLEESGCVDLTSFTYEVESCYMSSSLWVSRG